MTSKTHQFKNAMRAYAAELICSTGVWGFQTFKPVFCTTTFPGPCPYLECGAGKGPGIGWSRVYLNIHKNTNV